jgi:hypothetical protein
MRPRFWRRRYHLVVTYGVIALGSGALAVTASLLAVQILSHMVRH